MATSDSIPQVIPFQYGTLGIRAVLVDGEPWFVLADLCKVLETTRSASNVAQRLDSDGVRQAYPILDSLLARGEVTDKLSVTPDDLGMARTAGSIAPDHSIRGIFVSRSAHY